MQTSFLTAFATTGVPVIAMLCRALTGAIVVVPFWLAVTWQVPAFKRLSEFPVTEQVAGVFVINPTTNPLEAVELRGSDLDASEAADGRVKESV